MLLLIWIVLFLVAASLLLLPYALRRHEIYRRYSGCRLVTCPEDQRSGVVSIDARHAMATAIDGNADLRISDCSRWPEHSQCNRTCLAQAVHMIPYLPSEGKARSGPIRHLPIFIAAFAAWFLGAVWHSPFMFREQWLDVFGPSGLRHAEIRDIVGFCLLLSLAVCLLFAYGVAWLLAVCHRKGVLYGVLMSAALCGTVTATNWSGIVKLPQDLLMIEASYAILAALMVGAIVGGLFHKPVMPQTA